MIQHYLKVAFRNLIKHKTQSFISMIGLAVGFTCFAFSALWIRYEMTYDNFHERAEFIYLAGSSSISTGDGFNYFSSDLLADYLLKNCPEVEKACKIQGSIHNDQVEYNGSRYPMQQIMVDSSFVSMFNIIALDGDNQIQLAKDQIAITDKVAKRIFGKESPIGKQLVFPSQKNAKKTIVAVVQSWEGHSMFSFDILLPYHTEDPHWFKQQCYTFLRTYPSCDIDKLKQKLLNLKIEIDRNVYPISTPISLLSTLRKEHPGRDVNVKLNHVHLFAWIGGLVILCGLCNYLTMLVTKIQIRKRELTLRKVNGASAGNLLILLLSELVLLLIISLGMGVMLIELVLPHFKRLSNIDESTSFFYGEVLSYLLFLLIITTGISALIIHFISKRTLLESMKCKSVLHLSSWFYKSSILCQLIIGIGFVFCTVVMMKQLNYLLNTKELGLEKHNVGVLYTHGSVDIPFNKILNQIPNVTNSLYGFCTPIPKNIFLSSTLQDWEGKVDGTGSVEIEQETLNQDYANFFHLEVLEGHLLNEKNGMGAAMINETAAKALGWNQSVGKKISISTSEEYIVTGVIKDIYYEAPSFPVKPVIYILPTKENKQYINNNILFKVREGTWESVSKQLQEEIHKYDPNAELQVVNMENIYDDYMKSEATLSKLLTVVSFICIIIAVFGIFSLVALSCEQRRKEIAIRKVNGASMGVILNLFFKEYLLLLAVASLIAFPLGYAIMKRWLESYMKQTTITFWIYGGIFILIALIVFMSIIWKVWKAARQNPAEVIKNE